VTEAEWLTCGSRVHMRRMLKGCWPRLLTRWVYFNLACVDRIRDLLDDPRCLNLLRQLEGHIAGPHRDLARSFHHEQAEVREAIRGFWLRRDDVLRRARVAAARAVLAVDLHTFGTSEMVAVAVGRQTWGYRQERRAHADLLRDVFGNPFRPVAFNSEWRTDAAVAIAKGMYESRDFGAMPILADALQDAGCDNDDILNHCRDASGIHVRGCWVVDLVLGKE
jgi:hypothetical protein